MVRGSWFWATRHRDHFKIDRDHIFLCDLRRNSDNRVDRWDSRRCSSGASPTTSSFVIRDAIHRIDRFEIKHQIYKNFWRKGRVDEDGQYAAVRLWCYSERNVGEGATTLAIARTREELNCATSPGIGQPQLELSNELLRYHNFPRTTTPPFHNHIATVV